jgi:hypothetical protein
VRRARAAGFTRFEFADGISEILSKFAAGGEFEGEVFLRLWTRILREQMLSPSD